MENDPDYRVNLDESPVSKDVLRRLGIQVVELNYERNKIAEERIEAWNEHHRANQLQSSSFAFTDCEEYFDLLEMGTSIIAHLMVAYFDGPYGYWWELLHEIVNGRRMGAYMYQKHVLFDECCQFFNEGEHDQAPKYIQTQWDRYILHGEVGDQILEHWRTTGKPG